MTRKRRAWKPVIGTYGGLEAVPASWIPNEPDDGRESAEAGLFDAGALIVQVGRALADRGWDRLGPEVDFEELVVLVVAHGGEGPQVGLEDLG